VNMLSRHQTILGRSGGLTGVMGRVLANEVSSRIIQELNP
jgi:hypothetical protein